MIKTIKKTLALAAVFGAVGLGVVSSANALEVAADDTGQVLLAPIFNATPGNNTEIVVINTSLTHAVKARICFRSQDQSKEVLDFILYLSPGDVWRGDLINNQDEINGKRDSSGNLERDAAGNVIIESDQWNNVGAYVKSTDDSVRALPSGNSFASKDNPAYVGLMDHPLKPNYLVDRSRMDNNEWGHIEIIGAYSVTGSVCTSGYTNPNYDPTVVNSSPVVCTDRVTVVPGMSKAALSKIFDHYFEPRNNELGLVQLNPTCVDANGNLGAHGTCPFQTSDSANLQLRGEMNMSFGTVVEPTDGLDAGNVTITDRVHYTMTALDRDAAGPVIDNPWYNVWASNSIDLGDDFRIMPGTVNNTIYEIEEALAANNFAAAYNMEGDNDTIIAITFPTKYAHWGTYVCTGLNGTAGPLRAREEQTRMLTFDSTGGNPVSSDTYSSPFFDNGAVRYSLEQFDNSEHSIVSETHSISAIPGSLSSYINWEVNIHLMSDNWDYDSGWYYLSLAEGFTQWDYCNYDGVPAIVKTMTRISGGMSQMMNNSRL